MHDGETLYGLGGHGRLPEEMMFGLRKNSVLRRQHLWEPDGTKIWCIGKEKEGKGG